LAGRDSRDRARVVKERKESRKEGKGKVREERKFDEGRDDRLRGFVSIVDARAIGSFVAAPSWSRCVVFPFVRMRRRERRCRGEEGRKESERDT
jgi:hypothetical protein